MSDLRIEKCELGLTDPSRAWLSSWVEVAQRLQASDPLRAISTASSQTSKLKATHPFYSYGEGCAFVVKRGGEVLGRALANLNWHARGGDSPVGYIGMWECVADEAAAAALLEAAAQWLAAAPRNVKAIVGPVDFSTWHSYRFTIHDDEMAEPFWLEPMTARHSPAQWRSFGFKPSHRYVSTVGTNLELLKKTDGVEEAQSQGYTFRRVRLDEFERELEIIWRLSLAGFADMRLFTPIGWQEFKALYAGMSRIVLPEYVWFALAPETNEEVGFCFSIPNWINSARATGGSESLFAKMKFLRSRGNPPGLVIKSMAILPEHQSVSVGSALMEIAYREGLKRGCNTFYHALMSAGNLGILSVVSKVEAQRIRRYGLLRLEL